MTDYFKYKKRIVCEDTCEICFGYEGYLKSEHWELFRKKIIESCGMCANCGISSDVEPIQIHHLNYKRLGREKFSDVIPLCEHCHRMAHMNKSSGSEFTDKSKFRYKSMIQEYTIYPNIDVSTGSDIGNSNVRTIGQVAFDFLKMFE